MKFLILSLSLSGGLLLGGCKPASTGTQTLSVAAASDLKFAMDALVAEYHASHPGTTVNVTYGSSGNFFAQLQNKAPFDLYFSADLDYPGKLSEAGLALDNTVFRYAIGHLVVWVPKSSPVDVEKLGMAALMDPTVKKIAIANPQQAPYGRAAVAAMKSLGVYEQAESRLVFGENIAQTAQFVQSGAADLGILSLSLALAPQMQGHHWEIPSTAYPPLVQGGIILNWTKQATAAREFRDQVLGEGGKAVLRRYGFVTPEN